MFAQSLPASNRGTAPCPIPRHRCRCRNISVAIRICFPGAADRRLPRMMCGELSVWRHLPHQRGLAWTWGNASSVPSAARGNGLVRFTHGLPARRHAAVQQLVITGGSPPGRGRFLDRSCSACSAGRSSSGRSAPEAATPVRPIPMFFPPSAGIWAASASSSWPRPAMRTDSG